jgi:hypothetical protein
LRHRTQICDNPEKHEKTEKNDIADERLAAGLDARIRDGLLALDELAAARHPLAAVFMAILGPSAKNETTRQP